MQQRRVHKSVIILSLMLGAVLFTGCGQLSSLPEKERYQYIDNVLEAIDYETAGEVTSFMQDNGDGVFSPSVKRVEYKGEDVFDVLKERLHSQSSIVCDQNFSERQVDCDAGHVTIFVKRESVNDPNVILRITDVLNGREPND